MLFNILIETLAIFFFGSIGSHLLGHNICFLTKTAIMIVFARSLYCWLLSEALRSKHLAMLVGIVFGVFFHSIANFIQRLLDPNLLAVLQGRLFASFNSINANILMLAIIIVIALTCYVWRYMYNMHILDELALGRETAINLSVDHRRIVRKILLMMTVFITVSIALVGPLTFFALLVANLT